MLKVIAIVSFFIFGGVSTAEEKENLSTSKAALERSILSSVDLLVRLGFSELRNRGYVAEADAEEIKYNFIFSAKDLGDHEPWRKWLTEFYELLVNNLGIDLVEFLHLDDINIINYAVPVAFAPEQYDIDEYRLHFVPLAGVCAYWSAYGSCTSATWTAGALFLVCTPVGMVAERVMIKRIAPGMSDRVHKRGNLWAE